jgi:3-isopropylmalate/(R)-2-methylmalate dehydratase large subunit
MKLTGRILYLLNDADLVARQLRGEAVAPTPDAATADYFFAVNTDLMISGQACTLGYTPKVLGPHFLKNFLEVVDENAIAAGGFQVIVGGDAYGSGSSREHAPVAHQGAGIELIVAKSFQRIFQENLVYCGLPFTTDFGVLDRLTAGEELDVAALAEELPPFFRAVAKAGGLLPYAKGLYAGTVAIPPPDSSHLPARAGGLNVIEKIVAQNALATDLAAPRFGIARVAPGDQVLARTDFRGLHEYTAGMVLWLYHEAFGAAPVHKPEAAAAFEDHFVLISHEAVPDNVKKTRLKPAMQLTEEMVAACGVAGIPIHGPGRDLPPGVCHRIAVERYAVPGSINVLTDSHTPTIGVLNNFSFGIGSTAMAFALRTGVVPVTVPKTVRIVITGEPKGVVTPKDLILHIIGDPYFREEHWRTGPTDTCVIQLGGPGLDTWSVDELSVLTNMTVEGGLMTGVVEPNEAITTFLTERRGLAREAVEAMLVYPDADAHYEKVITIDLATVPVTVASPGDSRNRVSLADAGPVAIQNVVVASCTGASLADLRAAADIVRGRSKHASVRVTVTPSSTRVAEDAEREGLLDLFRAFGALVTPPGCGSCIGNGPGIPLPGETTASTTNRNFDRRMGAPGPVWLVSPAVAAASAITGHLTDPRDLR